MVNAIKMKLKSKQRFPNHKIKNYPYVKKIVRTKHFIASDK